MLTSAVLRCQSKHSRVTALASIRDDPFEAHSIKNLLSQLPTSVQNVGQILRTDPELLCNINLRPRFEQVAQFKKWIFHSCER